MASEIFQFSLKQLSKLHQTKLYFLTKLNLINVKNSWNLELVAIRHSLEDYHNAIVYFLIYLYIIPSTGQVSCFMFKEIVI